MARRGVLAAGRSHLVSLSPSSSAGQVCVRRRLRRPSAVLFHAQRRGRGVPAARVRQGDARRRAPPVQEHCGNVREGGGGEVVGALKCTASVRRPLAAKPSTSKSTLSLNFRLSEALRAAAQCK